MSISIEDRSKDLVAELGLGTVTDVRSVTPLTGGVSSDIALVDLGNKKICVKFALEQLKVAQEWHARVERNLAEYKWLEFASTIVPESTPTLLGCSETSFGFAMEYLDSDDAYLWKSNLLKGKLAQGEAGKVGTVLGKIHAASSTELNLTQDFQNQQDFHELRLEPYLLFTATRHPELKTLLHGLVSSLESNQLVLVHGDVSPKNIIFRNDHPVLLDSECATIGDPVFDVAFCLNHLILKALHIPTLRAPLLEAVNEFWDAYSAHIKWEAPTSVEERLCRLLPAMMLARVDGKSPVEYLDEDERSAVRMMSIALLKSPEKGITHFVQSIQAIMEKNS